MIDYLFVYGTLRRDSRSEMFHLLARHAVFVGDSTFQGKLFRVDYYPGVVASENPNDVVHGEVYKLIASDIVLARLDDYEECGPGYPEPHEYIRRKQNVTLNGEGSVIPAWIYLYNRPIAGLELIPSGDFYNS